MLLYIFFFNDTATTEIYTYLHTLSLHDALPISVHQHLAARLVDHHRGASGGVEVDELVAAFPRRFAHQFISDALFAQQKTDLARKGTERELIELPHGSGIAAAEIGRAHVGTPVTNAHLVCRLLIETKTTTNTT